MINYALLLPTLVWFDAIPLQMTINAVCLMNEIILYTSTYGTLSITYDKHHGG